MKARGRIIVVATATLALLASADGASARSGFEVQERSLRSTVSIKGSNGFQGTVTTKGHRQVALLLERASETLELRTVGRVSPSGIAAKFGDLAHLSLRFEGAPVPPDRRGNSGRPCRGRVPIIEQGVFHGTIHLRGENDFTRIEARQAPGTVERRFQRICRKSRLQELLAKGEDLVGDMRFTQLEARARAGGANVTFMATALDFSAILGPEFPPLYGFAAQAVERREGMRVVRATKGLGGDHSFLASKPSAIPQTVTVVPPPPFFKGAEHLKEHGIPATWVGPLAVRLPGAGLVPLTGPNFKSAFCGLTFANAIKGEHCLPRRDEPNPDSMALIAEALAQGSGSHSQAFWDARLS